MGKKRITSLSKKEEKGGKKGKEKKEKGKKGKEKGKEKGKKGRKYEKRRKKMVFGSHRKISKNLFGEKIIFFPQGQNIIHFVNLNVFKIWQG